MQTQTQQQPTQAIAKADPRQMDLKRLMESSKSAIASVVPKHLTADRLIKVALLATSKSPALLKCTARSILQSVMQAAELGLEVNSPLGHAYLIAYNNKIKDGDREQYVTECQFMIGYRGFIDLAKRSGQIETIEARCVYANDHFEVEYGTEQRLVHRPTLLDPGPLRCVYAIARVKDSGTAIFDVLRLSDVERARAASKTGKGDKGYGPWKDHYDEMARKTAVRRLAKYLPLSPELAEAIEADDACDSDLPIAPLAIEAEEPLTERLERRAAATRKPETVTMREAPTAPESEVARIYRQMQQAATLADLDAVMADARRTLKGADLDSAERFYQDKAATVE